MNQNGGSVRFAFDVILYKSVVMLLLCRHI